MGTKRYEGLGEDLHDPDDQARSLDRYDPVINTIRNSNETLRVWVASRNSSALTQYFWRRCFTQRYAGKMATDGEITKKLWRNCYLFKNARSNLKRHNAEKQTTSNKRWPTNSLLRLYCWCEPGLNHHRSAKPESRIPRPTQTSNRKEKTP